MKIHTQLANVSNVILHQHSLFSKQEKDNMTKMRVATVYTSVGPSTFTHHISERHTVTWHQTRTECPVHTVKPDSSGRPAPQVTSLLLAGSTK